MKRVGKKQKAVQAPINGNLPDDSAISSMSPGWQPTGFCSACLERLEAWQPGGTQVRHIGTGIPYGGCRSTTIGEAGRTEGE